jgi:hypothetical protein
MNEKSLSKLSLDIKHTLTWQYGKTPAQKASIDLELRTNK